MEVAMSTAKFALNSVVKTTATTITNEIGILLGVQEELFFIKEELEMMRAFLRAASIENLKGEIVTTWIKQVRELAFDVEDCLQEASVHLMRKSCLPVMCSMKKRHHIARKIRVLKTRIEDVSNRNLRYNLINKETGSHSYDDSASTRSIATVEDLLVGLDGPKRKLVHLILKEHVELRDEPWKGKVISVVGMGGLGKTTLVREVYDCQEIRGQFNCFAWVTVQHPFNIEEFIEILTKQIRPNAQEVENKIKLELLPKNTINEKMEEKVTGYLKDNKYLIVLDDLSRLSEWDKIIDMLPRVNGSKIVVTTRYRRPLAESISHPSENIYEVKELSDNDAFDLFCKAVYKTPNYHLVSGKGPSSIEIKKEDSRVQKQCITNIITEEEDREMKDHSPHKSKYNMDYGSSSIEITEEDSQVQKQCITITITEEEGRVMKDDPSHESKCDMEYGSSSTEITEEDNKVHEQCITNTITEDMKTRADLIIKSCGRLPLAIVTIGSYLATKPKTSAEWKTLNDHLSSEIAFNPDLGVVNNVLTSSYDGLPHHLKPSLLYLSVFHNHKEIRRSRIIRRWIADGYVTEGRKKTAEEVGKGYFYELMGRSLIQPSQMSTIGNGDVKRCNIHDMMYELILAKAVDESMVSVLEDENLITLTDNVRHLVIAGIPCKGGNVLERVKLTHMRSITIFGEVGNYLKYPRMKLVRVLDLEGTVNLHNQDLRCICNLRHLKYLGLRGTKITELPDSLGKLSELETLDIRNTKVALLPTGLTKLQKLSYLRAGLDGLNIPPTNLIDYIFNKGETFFDWLKKGFDGSSTTIRKPAFAVSFGVSTLYILCCLIVLLPCIYLQNLDDTIYFDSHGVRAPRGIGELRSLNILGMIDIGRSKGLAKEMQNLTNLRKLGVTGFTKENGKTLGKVIDGLKHLRSLVLKDADASGLRLCLESVSSPPNYLQSLKLYGPLGELPNWIDSLENLEKLHLRNTKLTGEIKAIEKLPNLKILYMLSNSLTCNFKELHFGKGTFPMLQVLILEKISGLELMSVEKTALKRLEQLKIRECRSIGPDGLSGLEFLVQLKDMEVVLSSFGERNKMFLVQVNEMQEKLSMLQKKPVLRVINERLKLSI